MLSQESDCSVTHGIDTGKHPVSKRSVKRPPRDRTRVFLLETDISGHHHEQLSQEVHPTLVSRSAPNTALSSSEDTQSWINQHVRLPSVP